jgi:hypothetical protein
LGLVSTSKHEGSTGSCSVFFMGIILLMHSIGFLMTEGLWPSFCDIESAAILFGNCYVSESQKLYLIDDFS